ncbi:roadblock/LC7 domain-containing protein [Phytohabitans kaempferiae]|uniref:Roadblock/LC7 domain-containing protein n=1 Tax=Phytohabitans kaempferiae TaxID=1620943 RepID=A0ABV6MCZ9_9ACTN
MNGIAELRVLRQRLPDIAGAVLASTDGMLIASDMGDGTGRPIADGAGGNATGARSTSPGMDAEAIAALSAATLGLGQRFAATVRQGQLRETVIQSDGGSIVTYGAGQNGLLTLLTRPHANLARIHHEARRVAPRLGQIVDGSAAQARPAPMPNSPVPDRPRLARRTPMAAFGRPAHA